MSSGVPAAEDVWMGLHFDAEGRISLYGMDSKEYRAFVEEGRDNVNLLTALRSNGRESRR